MATFLELKSLIANDLDRLDLTEEINTAVLDAVTELEVNRYEWNQSIDFRLSTVADQEWYQNSDWTGVNFDKIIEVDDMWVRIAEQDHRMTRKTVEYLQNLSQSTPQKGQPYLWAYFDNKWRLYPVPDQAFTITMKAHYTLPALSADGDENGWTGNGKQLTRARAKQLLYAHTLHSPEKAATMGVAETMADNRLSREISKKSGAGFVTPTTF